MVPREAAYSRPHFLKYVYLHAEVNSPFEKKSLADYVTDPNF